MQIEPARITDHRKARGVSATLLRVSFVIGAAGLLGAMSIDALAVIGRHIDVPLLGSIELSEACIVGMASASLASATQRCADALSALLDGKLKRDTRDRRAL